APAAALPARPIAIDADDLLLLRLVHEMEEGVVRAQEPDDLVLLEPADDLGGAVAGRGILLVGGPFAQLSELFHQVEDTLASLLANRLAEHLSQQVHLLREALRDPRSLRLYLQSLPAAHSRWSS